MFFFVRGKNFVSVKPHRFFFFFIILYFGKRGISPRCYITRNSFQNYLLFSRRIDLWFCFLFFFKYTFSDCKTVPNRSRRSEKDADYQLGVPPSFDHFIRITNVFRRKIRKSYNKRQYVGCIFVGIWISFWLRVVKNRAIQLPYRFTELVSESFGII